MEHVSSVRPTGKFPEKVENLKRWSRFPGWNFRTECRVPFTFLVVCTSSRSTVGHPATYRGLRPNGTTFYQSEIPLLLPPKFPGFFPKWKAPLEFRNQPTIAFFAAVNHLNGPLRKQNFTLTGSKGQGLWFVIGGFRSVLCVSVFQGSLLVIVIMIDGSDKHNCEGGFWTLEFACLWKAQ